MWFDTVLTTGMGSFCLAWQYPPVLAEILPSRIRLQGWAKRKCPLCPNRVITMQRRDQRAFRVQPLVQHQPNYHGDTEDAAARSRARRGLKFSEKGLRGDRPEHQPKLSRIHNAGGSGRGHV